MTTAKDNAAVSKKPKSSPPSHPPYIEMVKEAIGSLKERTGSSHYAIAKFIEEKHAPLPSNFKKLLFVQLKKFVAGGKLVKVKNSFKLPPSSKPRPVAAPTTKKPAPEEKKPEAVPKRKTAVKPKAAARPAKTSAKSSPEKIAAAMAKVKKAPAKAAVKKKPKSLKSPAKKGKKMK